MDKESAALAQRNKERAMELGKAYYKEFYNPLSHELLFNSPNTKGLASCWEYIGLMEMTDKLAYLDHDNIPLMENVIVGLEYYGYLKDGKLWGYVVNRGQTPRGATDPGLAFDDNEWLIINFLRAYEITGDKKHLQKAEYLADFLIREAWFEPLGGMFWDSRKHARHSCSNNPLIKPLVDLYRHTGKEEYLAWAKKIYAFSVHNLKDREKNIYEDLICAKQQADGTWVEGSPKGTGFYTYNTGTMISGAAALYGITGEQAYLDEALSCAKGAYDYFGDKTVKEGYVEWPVATTIWFNCILLKGYIDLYPYAKEEALIYIEAYQKSIDYAYDHYKKDGFLPVDWLRGWREDVTKDTYKEALDHSANVEMYALLSIFEQDIRED